MRDFKTRSKNINKNLYEGNPAFTSYSKQNELNIYKTLIGPIWYMVRIMTKVQDHKYTTGGIVT